MKFNKKILAVLLALALICSLVPAAFAANTTKTDGTEKTKTEEPAASADPEETAAPEESAAPAEDEESDTEKEAADRTEDKAEDAEEEEDELIIVYEGETAYNDGKLMFNNGGTVYNNQGTVYNNNGITYNNEGIVYNNGGTVYNNNGTVYNNGGKVYDNGGDVVESSLAGIYSVTFDEDYSDYVTVEGCQVDADEALWVEGDDVITITANEGYVITGVSTNAGDAELDEAGVVTITGVDKSVKVTLILQLAAPEFSPISGTYADGQTVKLTAAEGAAIYYTTDGTEPSAENGQKYTGAITVSESTEISAIAVMEGLDDSEVASESYAFITIKAPEFEAAEEGYKAQKAQGIVFENDGTVNAVIESVEVTADKDKAFTLNSTKGGSVEAGDTDDTTWTLRPATGLKAGTHTATVTVTFDSGETVDLTVSFKVTAAEAKS